MKAARLLSALLASTWLTSPALAQVALVPSAMPPATVAAGGFTGVGDVQASALGWYGVVPYTAAYAAAGGKSFAFSCNAGAITGDVVFQTAGTLDVSPVSGCSGTISVTTVYDQSGANDCTGLTVPCPLDTIATGSISFLQSGCPATSVITYCFSISSFVMGSSAFLHDQVQPTTVVVVMDRTTAGQGHANTFMGVSGTFQNIIGALNTNDNSFCYNGTNVVSASMTDNAVHTLGCIFHDAVQSYIQVDANAAVTGNLGSTVGWATNAQADIGSASNAATGYFYQGGFWGSDVGTTALGNIAHNMCVNTGSSAAPTC